MKIGKYFTKKEFEHSNTAIKNAIDNKMDYTALKNATKLVEYVLDPLREHLDKPIIINSGYRSSELNHYLGGVKDSQHLTGEAADIRIGKKGFDFIRENLPFDQLIWEFGNDTKPQWVHVSYKDTNRGQVLRAMKRNNKTIYKRI